MVHILRLPRMDEDGSFILVNVTSVGRQTLDLKLVGTEGSAPYVNEMKHTKVNALRSKSGQCTEFEWVTILQHVLLSKTGGDDGTDGSNVEAVVAVEENESITITIRRRIEGITQRLGTLSLSYDDTQEIELFDWCGLALQGTSHSESALTSLNTRFQELQEMNRKLQSQLEDLIAAKKSHEAELMEKFSRLLNEKKAKIRDQQRILASAKVDPKKLAVVQASRQQNHRTAGASAAGKRKSRAVVESDEDSEDDEGFEKMEVDTEQVPNDSDEAAITPDEDDDEDETADEDEEMPVVEPPTKNTSKSTKDSSPPSVHTRSQGKGGHSAADVKPTSESGKETTPPRRDLPFLKKSVITAPPLKTAEADGDETASEDDEL